ncbi:methyltransferase family protein [Roseivirga pacifica]
MIKHKKYPYHCAMWWEHLFLFLAWAIYYALHSAFASARAKSKLGLGQKNYRLLYSVLATLGLFTVLIYGATIYSVLLFPPSPTSTYIGLMLSAAGIFIIKRAFRKYSFRAFLGLKKEEAGELVTDGIQAKVRHPLYSGTVLLVLGYLIFNPQLSNAITFVSLLIYLPIGIRLEERKLIDEFGDTYREYQQNVPSLVPRIFKQKQV